MRSIQPLELKRKLDEALEKPVLLDVREAHEHAICKIENSLLIPMAEVALRLDELNPEQEIVVICHHGVRSMQIGLFLENSGFKNIVNLTGGIDAWSRNVDPELCRY